MKKFGVLQFEVYVSCQLQLIRDGVYTMMHEVRFVAWAAKPKNWPPLGLSQEQAKIEFARLMDLPDTITDEMGPYHGN